MVRYLAVIGRSRFAGELEAVLLSAEVLSRQKMLQMFVSDAQGFCRRLSSYKFEHSTSTDLDLAPCSLSVVEVSHQSIGRLSNLGSPRLPPMT